MFCITELDNADNTAFKVPDEDFEELAAGDTFIPAPHMQRARWVKVVQPQNLKLPDWKAYIAASYNLVKAKLPKKVQATL